MANKMWMGIPGSHMQWVPCPSLDSAVQRNRYVERIQFENGGGDAQRSSQYQMEYQFSFSGLAHEVEGIDAFNKFAQGFYGDGLIYLAHPANFETNMFPAAWATPALIEQGWKNIGSTAPTFAATNVTSYGQPQRTATWNITQQAGTYTKKTTIPIPPGYTLHLGVSGIATGSGVVRAVPIKTDQSFGTPVNLTLLSKSASTRMNTTFDGDTYCAVNVYITRTNDAPAVTTNLVINPSFELNTTGWTIFGSASIARVTSQAYSGSASLEVVATAAEGRTVTSNYSTSASATYTGSVWVKGEAGKTIRFTLREMNSGGGIIGDTSTDIIATGNWERITATRNFSSTGVLTQLIVRNTTSDAHTFYVDAAQLELGSTATTYFDGNMQSDSITTYAWTGTVGASASTRTTAEVSTVSITSMMAQLYKNGTTPTLPTSHYTGEGSTGLMFADDAVVENYSYMHPPRKGISTKLIEVEAWR